MKDLWRDEDAGTDDISKVVYLSNLIGADVDLVQPGGGNTSVKLAEDDVFGERVEALVVKGSGTDLRTITAAGFTHLSGARLATALTPATPGDRRSPLRETMSDEEMMSLMRACMLFPDRDPVPSVETPLHSIIPHRFVAHTHDVATLSLSDTPSARENVERVYGTGVAFLEYLRPGFPLAKGMAERYADGLPKETTGLGMEAAFWGGWALRDCLTPGVFGAAFAEAATENPYTREAVIGYVPLSKNPAVVMRFVSRTFGHSKELWHMVRAYIALVAYNLDREWCSPLLKQHADVLLDAYRATVDLRGGTEKVPLRQAFQHVLANYATCLRNRYPPDIRCIVGVCERLLPGVEFEKQKIEGMAQVIETFSGLHRRHQARGSMAPNVFDTDDWGHFKAQRRDLCALISYIFWRQDCRRLEHYRHLKLMVAVDTVISRDPLGPQLLKALAGDPSFEIPPVALAEPSGDHFGPAPPFEAWSWAAGGRPKDRCVHCGYYFITAKAADGNWKLDRVAHLKKAFHPYFYNGQKAVLAAIDAQPEKRFASESIAKDIFRLAKRKLFREYGEMAGFLHTKHCKTVLAHFVTKLLECRETAIANA